MVLITSYSFKSLFLVSILHSSQNTKESLLVGSECVLKQFRQIECPHTRVSGSLRNSKQLKQLSVESNVSTFFLFFYNILIISFLILSKFSLMSQNFFISATHYSYLSVNFLISIGKLFSISLSRLNPYSISLQSFLISKSYSSNELTFSLRSLMIQSEPPPSSVKSLIVCFSYSISFNKLSFSRVAQDN